MNEFFEILKKNNFEELSTYLVIILDFKLKSYISKLNKWLGGLKK